MRRRSLALLESLDCIAFLLVCCIEIAFPRLNDLVWGEVMRMPPKCCEHVATIVMPRMRISFGVDQLLPSELHSTDMARPLPLEYDIGCRNPQSNGSSIAQYGSKGKRSTRQHSYTGFLDPYRNGVTPGMPVGSLTRSSSYKQMLKPNVDLPVPIMASDVIQSSGRNPTAEPMVTFIPQSNPLVHDQTRSEPESAVQNSWRLRRTSSTVTARLHERWNFPCAACILELGADSRRRTFVDPRQSDVDGVVEDGGQQQQGAAPGPVQGFFKSGRMKQSRTIG